MEPQFWHDRWGQNEIGFHEPAPNPLLVRYFDTLGVPAGGRIFLPLCGKTLDIPWLLDQGYRVAGVELSPIAIDALFNGLGASPDVSQSGAFTRHSLRGLYIFCGDFFALTGDILGPVDAVYDRAALVALPEDMRVRYSAHLTEIAPAAPRLLIVFDYDQASLPGPPFSIADTEVARHYHALYHAKLLAAVDVAGGLKKKCPATEKVWHLTPRTVATRASDFSLKE